MNQNQKFKVKQFQWFQMQTKVRQMIQQIIQPIQKRIMQHSSSISKVKQNQSQQTNKLQQLSLMVTNDPKIFQIGIFKQVDMKFQIHQKSLQQLRRLIKQQNQFVNKRFQLIDIRMKQANQVMKNISLIKQRINKQTQIQNENINKIRINLQNMMVQLGQQIKQTNQKINQNFMLNQKTDNQLADRLRSVQNQLSLSKQAIQKNKQMIFNKNIQVQTHEFKLDKAFQRIKILQQGQNISYKLQQYIKDMQVAIQKAQFRVQAITPLITMAQIQQALEYILPDKMKKKILIFGHKKYSKLNKQILQKRFDQVKEKFNGIQLVEQMQKKNTRQITQLKRKKIISMGIDIDHLTFQARQRYYQQVDMDQLSQDQSDSPINSKIDQAQILNLVSLYFNQFTTDVSQKVKNQLDDTKAYLYGMQSQIRKQMQMNEQRIKKSQQHCMNFHRDQMLQMKDTQNKLQNVLKQQKQTLSWLQRNRQVQRKIYNFCSLVNHLQIQDQIDKQNISLLGIQQNKNDLEKGNLSKQRNSIIQIQKNCFSCCGYPASVLSSFKMACLAYHPSQIVIDSKNYRRQDILQFTTNILQTIKGNLQLSDTSLDSQIKFRNQPTLLLNKYDSQETLQKLDDFEYNKKSRLQIISKDYTTKATLNKSPDKQQQNQPKGPLSLRFRKGNPRKQANSQLSHTSQQKTRHSYNSNLKSQNISKDMVNVSNTFMELKRRHLSFLS